MMPRRPLRERDRRPEGPRRPLRPRERRPLNPEEELELASLRVRLAELDETDTMANPERHPKAPHPRESPLTDRDGQREVDIQRDTPDVGRELGPTDRDIFGEGLFEFDDLRVGPI